MSVVYIEKLKGIKRSVTLPGRGMLIPIETLKKLNFFDEKFVQYHSDIDFCLRANKLGYQVYISWDAVVYSHVNLTSSSSSFKKQSFRAFLNSFFDKYSRNYIPNRIRFIWRHNSKIYFPVIFGLSILLNFKNYFFKKKISV